jgi:amidase
MARNVSGLAYGMRLLDPSFTDDADPIVRVGRLRLGQVDSQVDDAVDRALAIAGLRVVDCGISEHEWEQAVLATNDILWVEAAESNIDIRANWVELQNGENLEKGLEIAEDTPRLHKARAMQGAWRRRLTQVVDRVGLIVLPTIATLPPTRDAAMGGKVRMSRLTSPINLSGLPALALPLPITDSLPASIQLVGPANGEAFLLATAAAIEQAVTNQRR